MIQYVEESKRRMAAFPLCAIMQIPREENEKADFLARMRSSALEGANRRIQLIYARKKLPEAQVAAISQAVPQEDWRDDIIRCLRGHVLLSKRE